MKRSFFGLATLSLAIGLFVFSSCNREPSDAVDQDRIFTTYELFYDANDDVTYARATFQFSSATGTRLELVDPSEVLFEGSPLSWKPALAYYETELAGFVDSGTFEWTDTEGNSYTNTAEIFPIDFPDGGIDTVGRDAAYELTWEGDAVDAFMTINVTANGENEGDAQAFSTANVGATSIILPKDKLEQIGVGPGTMTLGRTYSPALQEATGAGGLLIGRYRAETEEVYFQ
jgi:hypothetical protein